METLFGVFEAVTNKIPSLSARIVWQFLGYPFAPYARTRITHAIMKANGLDGVTLIVITYFLFAFVLGIPTTRQYILSFDVGLFRSIDRLRFVDTKGREFVYLIVFVFIITLVTLLIIEFIRRRYRYGNKDRKEFFGMLSVFISFTIGWFLLSSIIINWLWGLVVSWNIWPMSSANHLFSKWEAVISSFLTDNQLPDATRILVQPAFLLVIWMAWKFGRVVMRTWHSKRSAMSLVRSGRPGEAVGQLSVGYWPAVTIAFLIIVSAMLISTLAQALFYNVIGQEEISHKESCFQTKTKAEVNLVISNNTTSERLIDPLYFRLFKKDADPKSDQIPVKIMKVSPNALMWLSNRGTILENNERRYFRLQFPVENLALDGELVHCDLLRTPTGDDILPRGIVLDHVYYPLVVIEKADGDSYSNSDAPMGTVE
jgi:hypothetical protein